MLRPVAVLTLLVSPAVWVNAQNLSFQDIGQDPAPAGQPSIAGETVAGEIQAAGTEEETGQTRAGLIEAERRARAAAISPEKTNPIVEAGHRAFNKAFGIWNMTQTGRHGVSLRLGGLAVGSGLALGPDYIFKRGDLYDPELIWESYAVGSFQGYYRLQSGLELPHLLHGHGFFQVNVFRFDYPRLSYYGPGPESRETGNSDYRLIDTSAEIKAGLNTPGRKFRAGFVGSYQRIRIRPGTAPGIAQTDQVYSVNEAHGLDRDANFLGGGFFLQYDTRDAPLDPHAGTYLFAQFQNINGSRRVLGGFNQYDLQAQKYFHYWNKRRVIATRIKATLTTPHPNTFVPFYLEPRLGGSDDLRGFRPYRFYDQNSIVATAEYRWKVVEPLDMALFADAGKVYRDSDTLSLSRMQTDIGFGLRAKAGRNVPFRLDVGFSREGAQLWLNFYNVF
jgi:hypothetical protein